MPLDVAVQMDPIEAINIAGDSTFALMLEAQRRGHRLRYYTPDSLSLSGEKLTAMTRAVTVRDEKGDHFTAGDAEKTDLSTMDVVLLRQDPPFDMHYVTTTHLLERIHPKTLVVNDPASVRNAPEKMFVMEFPQLMPPTLITRDRAEIEIFRKTHGDIVMKPLYGNGGAAVFKVSWKDPNFGSLYDLFRATWREPWVCQAFLPKVSEGDKRIILVDGAAAGAVNRVPAENDIRSNMVRGGAAMPTDLTPREKEICATIGPHLKARGLIFVGIDVIDGHLTEINVTSPTGLRAIKRLGGPDLAAAIWDVIEAKRAARGATDASPAPKAKLPLA
ncbi:MAG: glutathione synthase [Methylobacteriaceae bacterium]|nr:glutathione synthase [Methylobacteriaceae bacterium]